MKIPERIILSRTDSIGDVVLTLPMAGVLKKLLPGVQVIFLSKNYTREIVALSSYVDQWVSWDEIEKMKDGETKILAFRQLNADAIIHVFPRVEIAKLAKKAGISLRAGASGRWYHYLYCNKIVSLSRRNSSFHEAELNLRLLKPFLPETLFPAFTGLHEFYGIDMAKLTPEAGLVDPDKFNLVLHPKSKGSAREWPLERYTELITLFSPDRFKVFITGTIEEGKLLESFLEINKNNVINLTGKFDLQQLISFINQADGLVAASTGPLHIASMLGKLAVGVYPPIRPMHPGRWAPLGQNAVFVVAEKQCNLCRKSGVCSCMNEISAQQVFDLIDTYGKKIGK